MWKTTEGSTGRLLQLSLGYFGFYAVTGVTVKYFLGKADQGFPGMHGLEFLVYNTAGATLLCIGIVLALGWYRLESTQSFALGPLRCPREYLYIVPSGVCTAIVIPTTTLMYTLPISVMVAMVIMRGAVIVISRAVDAIQVKQGILEKKPYAEENIAVVFALSAVCVNLFWENEGGFDFLGSPAAVAVLGSYIASYFVRIYIMNYYKNTRPKGAKLDNHGFFAIEQIAASLSLVALTALVYHAQALFGWNAPQVTSLHDAIAKPNPLWGWAMVSGVAYGGVAFFSVFIFMFKGRTATFAGLVNRLISLMAGTASTLLFALFLGGKMPKIQDWASLVFIVVAVAFLAIAERKRALEIAKSLPASAGSLPARRVAAA